MCFIIAVISLISYVYTFLRTLETELAIELEVSTYLLTYDV